MSSDEMIWAKIKAINNTVENKKGLRLLYELLDVNSFTINDHYGMNMMWVSKNSTSKQDSYDILNLKDDAVLTIMGSGNPWIFESPDSILSSYIDSADQLLKDASSYNDKNNASKETIVATILEELKKLNPKLEYEHIEYRLESSEGQAFDEWVWCSHNECDYPATYNLRKKSDGDYIGEDEFNYGETNIGDIPLCKKHFEQFID